jgi:hypothetical protein
MVLLTSTARFEPFVMPPSTRSNRSTRLDADADRRVKRDVAQLTGPEVGRLYGRGRALDQRNPVDSHGTAATTITPTSKASM